jgi:hypothetical protein
MDVTSAPTLTRLPRDFQGIPTIWSRQFGSKARLRLVPAGATIAEIVATTEELPFGFEEFGVVRIGGHVIPREHWHRVRPMADNPRVLVTLELNLQGGGDKGAGAVIASIALMLAAVFLAPQLAGSFSGLFILGTSTAATLAMRALTPPPSLPALQPPGAPLPQPNAAGISGNTLGMAEPIPACIGDGCRVVPPLASPVLVDSVGDDQFAEACFVLAGPHQVTEPWIGKTRLSEFDDVEYEVFNAVPGMASPAAPVLLKRYGVTDAPNMELTRHKTNQTDADSSQKLENQDLPDKSIPKWQTFTSRTGPDEFWLTLEFSEGLTNVNTPGTRQAVPLRIQLRQRGSTDAYIKIPEIHIASNKGVFFRFTIRFKWRVGPIVYPKAPVQGARLAYKEVPGQTDYPPTDGWKADPYFSIGAGHDLYYAGDLDHNVRNISLYSDRVEVFLDPAQFPPAAYEVQVKQGMSYDAGDGGADGGLFTPTSYEYIGDVRDLFTYFQDSDRSYRVIRPTAGIGDRVVVTMSASVKNTHPVQTDKLTVISMRVKNQQFDQFSVIGALLVPDWTGSEWSGYNISGNPAVHFRNVLCGDLALRPVKPTSLNDDEVLVFRQRCIDQGFRVNGFVQGQNRRSVLDLIAGTGFGRFRESEKIGVSLDYDRSAESPVLPLSPLTMSDFSWKKAFPAMPSGYLVAIKDKSLDFVDREFLVMRPGVVDDGIYERITYDLIDNVADATARATFDLRSLTQRMTFYSCTVGPGHLIAPRNAMAAVSHDIVLRQVSWARVAQVLTDGASIYGLVLTNPISTLSEDAFTDIADAFSSYSSAFESARYGVMVERRDGSVSVHEIEVAEDYPTTILFVTPFADPGNDAIGKPIIGEDCNVYAGPLGQEYLRLIVNAVTPNADKTADLTLVDEAPSLWAEDGSVNLAA